MSKQKNKDINETSGDAVRSHGGLKDSTSAKSEQTVATLLERPSWLECPYLFIFFFNLFIVGSYIYIIKI